MTLEDECFNLVWEEKPEQSKENEGNIASNSDHSDLKLYGMPIESVENIIMVISFLGTAYLLYVSKVLSTETIVASFFGILIFLLMFAWAFMEKSMLDIITKDIDDFSGRFSKEDEGNIIEIERITTGEQIAFLTKLAMNIVSHWKVSWTIYAVIITILYIIAYHIGLFLTVLLLLIISMVIILKLPEISKSFKKYLKSKTKEILADPPHVGVMTLFDRPLFGLVLDAGTAIVYPGVIDFLPIEVHMEPQDFKDMKGFVTKDNISVELKKVQVLYIPDILRLKEFISAKKQTGVYDVLDSMISNKLKDMIITLDFEELLKEKNYLEKEIKLELTGKDTKKSKDVEDIENMGRNGLSDNHLMGVIFHRFNIGTIEASEEYTKEMLKKQIEEKQKQAETIEVGTEVEQATLLFNAFNVSGEPKSFAECLMMVKDDKIAREGHSIVPGLRKALNSFDPRAIAEIIRELKK